MRSDYEAWLRAQGYDGGTVTTQLYRVGRVEQYLGDLGAHFLADRMDGVIEALTYSTADERQGRENSTGIPLNGNLRANLASYRNAAALYRRFLGGESVEPRPYATPIARSAALRRMPQSIPAEDAHTLAEFAFDGYAALSALIATSRYGTLAQAVASLAVFSHPATVVQTDGKAVFPTTRGVRGEFGEIDGRRVMFDDNTSPTDAFLWANGLGRRGRDTQFNHIYAASGDADAYTALPNIVMTPAFLAKLTDTSPEIRALLAWRSYDLYGWKPQGYDAPTQPDGYTALEWAAPLPPVTDVRAQMERLMAGRPTSRTVLAARRLGWLFGPTSGDAP